MRFEYIEPIVDTTKKVLAIITRDPVTNGDLVLVPRGELHGDVSIVIRVKGDSEGYIVVNMNMETARNVCGAMNGSACVCATPAEMDSIMELSNMIAGNATSSLNDLGYDFDVLPPSVIATADVPARTGGVEIFQVPLGTKFGQIYVNVALRMN